MLLYSAGMTKAVLTWPCVTISDIISHTAITICVCNLMLLLQCLHYKGRLHSFKNTSLFIVHNLLFIFIFLNKHTIQSLSVAEVAWTHSGIPGGGEIFVDCFQPQTCLFADCSTLLLLFGVFMLRVFHCHTSRTVLQPTPIQTCSITAKKI